MIRFNATDTTNADVGFLKQVLSAVVAAGAGEVSISDLTGTAIPGAMAYIGREAVSVAGVPVRIHCHNDFGLALANTLAAVEAGATIVDGTINGLGERTGNVSLDELIAALEFLYGIDTGVDIKRLTELSRMLEEMTGVAVPKGKPIVGRYAFAHTLDAHAMGVVAHPELYELIDPSLEGNEGVVVLGKGSGPKGVRFRLRRLGIEATDEQVARLVEAVNKTASATRSAVTDDELRRLVKEKSGL
ncbi:MAG: hypothetical protein HY712_06620 [candidate division NC10 bacterium]|nr:hypothetical protein [candidate division NC10 bacterium]